MRNLTHYNSDCLKFQLDVVNAKNDSELKELTLSRSEEIISHNHHYCEIFENNTLNTLMQSNTSIEGFRNFYQYSSKQFVLLKNSLTTGSESRIIKCQYCTLNDVNSFDHIAPKNRYGAYAIHPLNLFPACTECNSYKTANYLENGTCKYINLYKDKLPEVEYLFVNVDIGMQEASIDIQYYLNNQENIENGLFRKIENHYNDLHLFNRFKENSYTEINLLRNLIAKYLKLNLSLEKSLEIINENIISESQIFGINYWKCALKRHLINNEEFLIDF